MGTLINAGAVVAGGLIGLIFKKIMPESLNSVINKIIGLCVIILGLFGVLSACATVTSAGKIETNGILLLIVSLVLGTVAGELLKLDGHLMRLGGRIEAKIKVDSFATGFVNASILFCVGAMAIIGSLQDGISGDMSTLLVKSMLDGISSIVMAASLGAGVIFAAVPLLLYQGAITLGAQAISPLISDFLLNNIFMVGFAIVIVIGVNMMGLTKIKTMNLVPSLIVPVLYSIIF